ncbi:DUF6083 domain-containing protein [Streptomyces termitum]|uniref:DUF6083 domain-containing protein n=1 Tax=Streptomyces termitum TaxID=67368 RepID=UPI00339F8CB6
MHPHPAAFRRRVSARRQRRTLTVAHDSPSRLLCCAQNARCPHCGNRIDRHTASPRSVSLHPGELPTELVPADYCWHLASGIAYPAGDSSPWCRIAHPAVCPADTHSVDLPDSFSTIRRRLALHTRRLIDTAGFTALPSPPPATPEHLACQPQRPIVQLLYTRYVAAVPVKVIQCVAQTVRRTRCATPVLAPEQPRAAGLSCRRHPAPTTPGTSPCLPEASPCKTSPTSATKNSSAGVCSTASPMPHPPRRPISPSPSGNHSTLFSIRPSLPPAC